MNCDALVIGGGLSGATVAAKLASAGCSTRLLERSATAHDKVCGDFLSHEALHYLRKDGVDVAALGAVPLTTVRLASREVFAETALPFAAQSLRRRILDEALLLKARAAGACIDRGTPVRELARQGTTYVARLDTNTISADSVFIATGKHDLLGHGPRRGWHNGLVAFKMYFRLAPSARRDLAGCVELILFPGGYAGLQPVDAGLANLCLLVTRRQLRRCGASWPALLQHLCGSSPHLAERLRQATPTLARPLALSAIPYGFLATPTASSLWPLGDQAAVIPSFSGDGMSIALHSAHLAAATFLAGESSSTFVERLRQDLRLGVTLSTALSHLLIRTPSAARLTRRFGFLLRDLATSTRIPARALIG